MSGQQQHGAVAGRVSGPGNTAPDTVAAADCGDPATDLIGTWRLAPGGDQYDIKAVRAVKIDLDNFPWHVVTPGRRTSGASLWAADDDVRDWPVTPASVVGAAARLHRTRQADQGGEPS